ncbi:glycosyltransferase family 2 protein [Calothrix sp. PCC 7507]|uniref:glycosyltransferase n=1 Tax=Calothrix sp. PCC 7507 TaxID=99598 RepID=UPI00029EEEC4|nr:glycosyltransferase family 2 protein [Calothrix sp. PCC 7507]AFY35890.1 glycosyl transferase family 2 [Calothrix sp. PCC 7507]
MPDFEMFLCKSLLGWLVIQVCITLVFLWSLRSRQKKSLPDHQLPKTAIVLCLRGADPFLPNCVRSLLQQNYPQYDLKLIVDHQEDAAWKIATDTIQEARATNVQISPLTVVRSNCSLKCSAIVQAVSELDDSYEVVALVDADTVVHPNWLRELVSPLADPKVGATTGNCWYVPTGNYWGSLVRYIGNVSTVVQMYLFQIPWGGSLAIKTKVLRETGLLDKWSQAFCEDMMIRSVLGKYKIKVKFVPSLLMLNQAECDLPSVRDWIGRQLLCSRLYHPRWSAVVGDAISSILFPTLTILTLIGAILSGKWDTAALLLGCYGSYTLGLLWLMLILEQGVQQVISHHSQPIAKLSTNTIGKMLIGIPLTQWVYGLGLLSSLWMPTVTWRGITYEVAGPWNIRLVKYQPYQLLDQTGDRKLSL